ncbi:subtilisin-like protein [Stipitochalara longipes BDJ]|nr:subtilisin-like protein [Stipitochalara longipes BDJ]
MKSSILFLVSAFAASVIAAPASTYTVHERRNTQSTSKWAKRDEPLDRRAIVPVKIGLTQRNLDNGHDWLMDVSDPSSESYGQHWTAEKVARTFAAEETTVTTVTSWLTSSGISEDRISVSNSNSWIRMDLTIAEAESLLKTEYKMFEHTETAKRSLAVDEYSIPAHVSRHVDFITPTVQHLTATKHFKPTKPARKSEAAEVKELDPSVTWDLSNCGHNITRACIQALYNMPNGTHSKSSLAVVELNDQVFNPTDLSDYMKTFVTDNPVPDATIYAMSDTTFNTTGETSEDKTGEGNLDVMLTYGLVYPQPIIYYQIGEFDLWFDAVDKTDCDKSDGYQCGGTPLAQVISTSWGWSEDVGDASNIRLCNEFMKLGLLGTTILFSSGDSGVGDDNGTFQVSAPAACPYVTAVGSTEIPSGGSINSTERATTSFASGGGFSNQWALPKYQEKAMAYYYDNYTPSYNSSTYNNTQQVRGYPDIAANGNNIVIYEQGGLTLEDGTSASAPIVASLISLINEERLAAGKSTVGFINPVLYANPGAMNDIVTGSNPGAGTDGFDCVPGWDPVSGLGTPDFERLLSVFMSLN